MNLTKKQRKIKYALYCLLILLAGLLQNVNGLFLEIGGARCFLLIPVAIALGIDEDERIAAFLGLFAGLIWDMVSAQHMGYNAAFIMVVCYISSFFVSYLLRATYWVTAVSSVIASVIYGISYWLFFVVIGGSTGAIDSLGYFYVPCIIYTSVVSLIVVSVLRPIKRKLNHEILAD